MVKNHVSHIQQLRKKLLEKNSDINITENVNMSKYTSFKAGGCAALMVEVFDIEQLKEVLKVVSDENVPHMILGNGSNTLFRDTGYEGVVIKLSCDNFSDVFIDETDQGYMVTAGAAILLSTLAKILLNESLTGFEFASGIPGSLGGALFMNAGAYDGEIRQIVHSVKAVSPDGRDEKIFSSSEMDFGYRYSALKDNGYIAVEACLKLEKGHKDDIAAKMKELAEKRNSKQPVKYPSAGSTFKRPEGYFAGKLIQDAGLKGVTVGGAQVSALHSGFIINKGGATATDIIDLITLVQNRVYDEFGVMLEPEVRIIG